MRQYSEPAQADINPKSTQAKATMIRETLVIAAAATAIGCAASPPAMHEQVASVESTDSAARAEGAEEKVCERIRRTGSHRSTVICRTRAEIEAEAVAGKDTFDQLYDSQRASREY